MDGIEEHEITHCSQCQQKYDHNDHTAKYMACFHSICKSCVQKTVTEKSTYKCPMDDCGMEQVVPVSGIDGLPDNKLPQIITDINNVTRGMSKCQKCDNDHRAKVWCKDCSVFLCKDCCGEHDENKDEHEVISCDNLVLKFKNGESNMLMSNHVCPTHKEKIESFCTKDSCQKAVCKSCVKDHSSTNGHTVIDLSKAAEKCRKELQCSIRDMKVISRQWTYLEQNKAKEMEQIETTTKMVHGTIEDFFQSCYDIIKEREQTVMEQANKYAKEMKEYVEFQNKKASALKERFKQMESVASMAIKYNDDKDIAEIKNSMVGTMKELSVPPASKQVIGPQMMSFSKAEYAKDRLIGCISGIGQLEFNSAIPYLSYCDDTIAFLDLECTVNIHMMNYRGLKCNHGGMNINVILKAPKTSTDEPYHLYDMKNGSYQVKFEPKVAGVYVAHVMLDGVHIKNSPLSIPICKLKTTVHPQVYQKPSKVSLTAIDLSRKARPMPAKLPIQAELDCPSGGTIRCDVVQESDKIYNIRYIPTEIGEHKLYIGMNKTVVNGSPISLTVRQYLAVGRTDIEVNKLVRPSALAIDSNDNIYVADTSINKRIQKYNMTHTCIGSILVDADGASSLVIDHDDNIIILFRDSKHIKILDTKGKILKNFTLHTLKKPIGLDVDTNGRIYVTDSVDHMLFILDYNGKILQEFGGRGKEPGKFDTPVDVCLYNDTIFISDRYNNRVQQLNEEGECIKIFGCCDDSFDMPAAITITSEGHLAVFDAEQTITVLLEVDSKEVVKLVPCYGDLGQFQWESIVATDDGMLLKVCPSQNCFRVYKI
ncbi:E3 ubiquitin-protein ligase TRIM71-like [Anneissia japonica]|uniref:E3 ubiquitin-protein ligase TRIM71-like n=1 Tax=Anneissia japonica TaxID=1529436 RepID=UPI001425909F|nr:E3 ubiquitin-protein ligase TRIM71-like [Anneissia japonica]